MRSIQLKLAAIPALLMLATPGLASTAPDTVKASSAHCEQLQVSCVDPHYTCEESKKVVEILQKLVSAYSSGDIKAYEDYLDDHCTMFDEQTKELIAGKQAVLTHLRDDFSQRANGGPNPVLSCTIDQPYAKVTGDTCVVSFVGTRQIGGAHPHAERANITDIFIKRGDQWKKAHWCGHWETVSSK